MYHPLTPGQSRVQSPVSFKKEGRGGIAGDVARHRDGFRMSRAEEKNLRKVSRRKSAENGNK